MAVIWVPLTTVKLVAAVVPKSTAVAPVKPVPVIVTEVPPAVGPAGRAQAGDGRAAADVGELVGGERGDVPPVVVTVTSTVPVPARAVGA